MDTDARMDRRDYGWVLASLGALLDLVLIVVGGGSRARDHDGTDFDCETFEHDDGAGPGYTMYGREWITEGKDGEPVGTYSGAPIIRY